MDKSNNEISLPAFNASQADNATSKSNHKKEFVAAFIACIGPIAIGTVGGYTATSIPEIKLKFPFHGQEESLIGSLMTLGAMFGGMVAGASADFLGRKSLTMYICVPFTIGWLLIAAAQNLYMIYLGRVFTGFCTGVISMCANVYVTEIASPAVRGILGSCFQLFTNFGILFSFVVGTYIRWDYLGLVSELVPALLLVLMIPLPESPSWLVRQGRRLEAIRAIKWLRGVQSDADAECREIEAEQTKESKMVPRDFLKPELYRPFILMVGEMAVQQLSGINAILFNTVTIFQSANKMVDAHIATIVIGVCAVVASSVTFFVIERAGRRILLLISATVMAIAMFALDMYYCLKAKDPASVADVWLLPIICLVIYIFFFNIGFGPVPWLMMGEVFPSQARGLASSVITGLNWGLAFIVTYFFAGLQHALGSFGVYWMFSVVCAVGVIFVYFFVPETKGKSIEEIQEHFIPAADYNKI